MTRAFTQWNPDSHGTGSQDSPKVPTDPRTLNKGNKTIFRPDDVRKKSADKRPSRKFERLLRHDLDAVAESRYDINMAADIDAAYRRMVMAALACQLEVSDRLRYRATRELCKIDVRRVGYPLPIVGFCLYVYFFDEKTKAYEDDMKPLYWESDPGRERVYWPSSERTNNDDAFQRVADNLCKFYKNVSTGGIQRILQKVEANALPKVSDPNLPMKQEIVG